MKKKLIKAIRKAVAEEQAACIADAKAICAEYGAMGFKHKPKEAAGADAAANRIAKRAGYVIEDKPHEVNSVMGGGILYMSEQQEY